MQRALLSAAVLAAACTVNEDPAEGGFISGIAGLSQGTFEDRQRELEATVAELRQEYSGLQQQLMQQRAELAAQNRPIPAPLAARVDAHVDGRVVDPADDRLEEYRKAVADARYVSELLANQ